MILLLLLAACGPDGECADRRDLGTSPGGLLLTEEEHALGWGKTECYQCHQRWDIHRSDCMDGIAVDYAAIEEAGVDGCAECHGWNGVTEWRMDSGVGETGG